MRPSCNEKHARDGAQFGEPLSSTATTPARSCSRLPQALTPLHHHLRRTPRPAKAGLTGKAFTAQAWLSYAKVAEYQRRGVVYFHAIIRLDDPAGLDHHPRALGRLSYPETGGQQRRVEPPTFRFSGDSDGSLVGAECRPVDHLAATTLLSMAERGLMSADASSRFGSQKSLPVTVRRYQNVAIQSPESRLPAQRTYRTQDRHDDVGTRRSGTLTTGRRS
jgi:hypothetical protein